MATGNQVSLCNRSLLAVGGKSQISALNEGSTQANACNTLFTPTFESLARAAYWNCLRKQAVLTLLQAASGTPENQNGTTLPLPPVPWLYAYQVPSDSLAIRWLVPSLPPQGNNQISSAMTPAPTCIPQEQIRFQVTYSTDVNNNPIQIILTNQPQTQAVYTVNQPNPSLWDSEFQAAFVASLGAFLVPALSMNKTLMEMNIKLAERMIAQARIRDGNEGYTSQDHIPDWEKSRNVGGGWGGYGLGSGQLGYGNYYGGYCSMGW